MGASGALSLTILSVNYPLADVSPDSCGGSEQVLCALDRALVRAGHRSIVVAPEGSRVEGTLVPVPHGDGVLDDDAKARAQAANRNAIAIALARWPVDLAHLHGLDFYTYMPPPGVPVLATLHLPLGWYPAEALHPSRPGTWLNCVSRAQQQHCPGGGAFLPAVENGVPVEALQAARHAKRNFALFLGRICPEKGVHLAIEAAQRADIPLLIAGELFPYEDHQRYFENEVRPRLDGRRRYIGPIGFARKRRLLTAARCLLAPFLAEETSSLVTREAIACGTPVLAFPNGALRDAVTHGVTGYLVEDAADMARHVGACAALYPAACRAYARARFTQAGMVSAYLSLYERLAREADPATGARA